MGERECEGVTREEAIEYWEGLRKTFSSQLEQEENNFGRMHLQTTIDAIDMAISAIWQQETVTNRNGLNEPLTLDELREMDGEPVWIICDKGFEPLTLWALVEVCEESIFLTNNLGGRTEYAADVELEDDGITVYRQKPEEGTV